MRTLKIILVLVFFLPSGFMYGQNKTPVDIVQGQLTSYNKQDLESFLSWYSDNVEIFNFPAELVYTGKEKMRERYAAAWKSNPGQRAEVKERINVGNTVIDKEHITGRANGIDANVIAIYSIENQKIRRVYFIRE